MQKDKKDLVIAVKNKIILIILMLHMFYENDLRIFMDWCTWLGSCSFFYFSFVN